MGTNSKCVKLLYNEKLKFLAGCFIGVITGVFGWFWGEFGRCFNIFRRVLSCFFAVFYDCIFIVGTVRLFRVFRGLKNSFYPVDPVGIGGVKYLVYKIVVFEPVHCVHPPI